MSASELSRQVLARAGVALARATPPLDVKATLQALWPVKTNCELLRIGSPHDGGYILLDDLEGVSDLFSPGVQDNWEFETDFVARTGAQAHLLDCNGAPDGSPFEVRKAFLGGFTDESQLGINEWIDTCSPDSRADWFLQMDIEGSEFEVISGIEQRHLNQFRGITIEMHRLDLLADAGWHRFVFQPFLRKLLFSFVPVHLHANNAAPPISLHGFQIPRLLEITFWRKDRIDQGGRVPRLPIPLDARNSRDQEDLEIAWGAMF